MRHSSAWYANRGLDKNENDLFDKEDLVRVKKTTLEAVAQHSNGCTLEELTSAVDPEGVLGIRFLHAIVELEKEKYLITVNRKYFPGLKYIDVSSLDDIDKKRDCD